MAIDEKKEIEDATLKKNKKGLKDAIKTILLIIVLVLIADTCILLALNKIGLIDINKQINSIPVMNMFVNEKVKEEKEISTENELSLEIESLKKQIQLKDADISSLTNQNDKLAERNKTLEEQLMKMEQEKNGTEKLIQYYTKMKPKQAAEAFNQLEPKIVIEILNGMSETTAAGILDKMLPEKVAAITEKQKGNKK